MSGMAPRSTPRGDERSWQHAPRFAQRVDRVQESGIRKLFDLARQRPDAIDLSIGQPPCLSQAARQALAEALVTDDGRYCPTEGDPAFLRALEDHLHGSLGLPREAALLATTGITGGFHLACLALLEQGDEVLVPDPGFIAHDAAISLSGARPVRYDTYPDFRLREDALSACLSPRTKALVICTPGNPGGQVITTAEAAMAADFAHAHDLLIFADEAYGELVYEGRHCSLATFSDQVLLFGGFSKSYGIAGWRLGYARGPRAIIERMRGLQQFVNTSAPTPAQKAMTRALSVGNDELVQAMTERRELLLEIIGDLIEAPPQGGLFAFFPAPWGSGSEFSAACLERDLVIVPGRFFSRRDTHCRLAFSAETSRLEQGLRILSGVAAEGPLA